MAPKNTVVIDGAKLRNELEKIDKYNSEIARECGYNPSYFSTCMYYNKMARPCMKMLTMLYGIKYDNIKPDDEKEPTNKRQEEQNDGILEQKVQDLTADRLYALIYTAVYDALKEVKGGD